MNAWPTKHRVACSKRKYDEDGRLTDWCQRHIFIMAITRAEAVETAKRLGWSLTELGRFLCPEHSS